MGIDYPSRSTATIAVWRAFDNNYWPALYLIDAKGQIRYHQFGEGEYEGTERVIQQLLTEAGAAASTDGLTPVEPTGPEVAADWSNLKSGENYVGYERTEGFASPGGAARDEPPRLYRARRASGSTSGRSPADWTMETQATVASNPSAAGSPTVFHARDLHLVMGPPDAGKARPLPRAHRRPSAGAAHGTDVDAQGNGTATEQRLYQLIRQPTAPHRATDEFEIEFLDPGVEAFAFTFG